MKGVVVAGCVAVVAACAPATTAAPRCQMAGVTERWLEGSLVSWETVRTRQLRIPPARAPRLVVFDRYCVYELHAGGAGPLRLRAGGDTLVGGGRPHRGEITLPDGQRRPARPIAFTALAPDDSTTVLFLALEDVWRQDPAYRAADEDWPSYLRRSFIHEMTHARQLAVWVPMLRIAGRRVGLADFDDDVIQQRFDTLPWVREAVLDETAVLFAAAAAGSEATRRALARDALERMRRRQVRMYGSADAPWARIERLLLDLEGAAQWAAMAHAANTTRLGAEARQNLVRGSREYWSQEQGLALYLVLDALVPGWQDRMFSPDPPSAFDLIERALAP